MGSGAFLGTGWVAVAQGEPSSPALQPSTARSRSGSCSWKAGLAPLEREALLWKFVPGGARVVISPPGDGGVRVLSRVRHPNASAGARCKSLPLPPTLSALTVSSGRGSVGGRPATCSRGLLRWENQVNAGKQMGRVNMLERSCCFGKRSRTDVLS